MGDYSIQLEAATRMSDFHKDAHDALADIKDAPEDIDGGDATDLLLSILQPLVADGGNLCELQADAANRLATVVDRYKGVEEGGEAAFLELSKAI